MLESLQEGWKGPLPHPMPTYNPVTGEKKMEEKKRSRVTLVSPPRSEHGDDVSVLLQVLGLALPDPLGLVAERS